MKKIALAAAAVLCVGAGTAMAGDWGHSRYHDDLEHRDFHRYQYHRDAHRYPMTPWQHGRLHDDLEHDAYHDQLEHRSYHRSHSPYYGRHGYGGYRPYGGVGCSTPGFYLHFGR